MNRFIDRHAELKRNKEYMRTEGFEYFITLSYRYNASPAASVPYIRNPGTDPKPGKCHCLGGRRVSKETIGPS